MTVDFNFWWLKPLPRAPRRRPLPLLKRVSQYVRQHPPARPMRSPLPFTATREGNFCYLTVSGAGLGVVCYDHVGLEIARAPVEDFFEKYTSPTGKVKAARKALENFHELLARYVFPFTE